MKANCQKERITLSKITTTVFELDTVHTIYISYIIELHKTAYSL